MNYLEGKKMTNNTLESIGIIMGFLIIFGFIAVIPLSDERGFPFLIALGIFLAIALILVSVLSVSLKQKQKIWEMAHGQN